MGVFTLKRGDTLPPLQVVLRNPDGSVHDLAGSTARKLHIRLSTGALLSRDMEVVGAEDQGTLQYVWQASDWEAGNLVVGPTLPLAPGQVEHRMEYEVVGAGGARLTFPNDGYDTLRIISDLANA